MRKVIPALTEVMKEPSLSAAVLNNIFHILHKDKFITTTEFRAVVWPAMINLCRSKELPAQTLFLLLKYSELILKFVSPNEFASNLMPLMQKSLECGVPKLQLLALEQIFKLFKSLDYGTFKTNLIPRMMKILEETQSMEVRIRCLQTIHDLQESIDVNTIKQGIFKAFEKLRSSRDLDSQVSMLMLKIYKKSSDQLGPDEIG